ncbi:hypothetical protein BB561_000569 [Smittium simulii]|uniref:Uncharacterized protein n=1 Tax=Smittium simulii TaxID=133385 RepID=A0A2T9YYG2_9FUNG|nr:hypothetical protein BB561_000569 [Smittium simulii]
MNLRAETNPKALKKICFGGSDKKFGCGWGQFSGDIDADIEYVLSFIGDIYTPIQDDAVAKTTYFIFYKVEQAIKFMKTPIFINKRKVDFIRQQSWKGEPRSSQSQALKILAPQ